MHVPETFLVKEIWKTPSHTPKRSESIDAEDANMIIVTGTSHLKESGIVNGRDQIGDGVGPRKSFRKYREADRQHINKFYVVS